nr:TonB-dependent receptor [uncultured Pedobacter sp.]
MKKRKILVVTGLGLVQLSLATANLFAQTKDSTYLNEVVVTASRSPKKIGDIGKIVKVISAEEISRAQGRTLPELLNNVAGLTIGGSGSNPGNVQSVFLRGASTPNTLILIDGIAVNDASGISGEYNLSAIDIVQIQRIEILKGASSTLYGSDAVAGVINIITKKGDGKLTANALLSAGSYSTYKASVGLSGQIEKTRISMNFSNLDSKGISSAEPANLTDKFEKDGFKQLSFGLNLSQNITDNFSINAGLQANRNKADLDAGAFKDDTDYTYNKTALLANVGAKLNLRKGELNVFLSQNHVKNLFNNDPTTTNNQGDISNAEGVFAYQFNKIIGITSGLNYKFTKTKQKYDDPSYPSSLNADNHITSVYTSVFLHGGNIFRMELGGRYNNHSQYGENFTYTINPSVIINQQLKYYVNISSAYRVPSLYQLYSEYGNLALKPEMSKTYETGVEGDLFENKLTYTVSVFSRKGEKVIDFGLIAPQVYGYVNQDRQNDKGVELELGFKPNKNFNFGAWYAFVDGKVKTGTTETFNLFRRPKNSVGTNLGYTFTPKFYASLTARWNDVRIDQYFDESNFTTKSVNLKKYSTVDAYLQFKANRTFSVFADIKNIFDTDYNDFAGYTAKGINFNAGLSFTFR